MSTGFVTKITTRLNGKTCVGFVGRKGEGIVDHLFQARIFLFAEDAQRVAESYKQQARKKGLSITARAIKGPSDSAVLDEVMDLLVKSRDRA